MNYIKISIVICTYNGSDFIREQLDSILSQSMKPNEILVCDDCSSDDTLTIVDDVIKQCDNKTIKFKIIKNEERVGVKKNFEKGIMLSEGDYIMLSDQDDYWKKEKIEITYEKMRAVEYANPGIPCLVYTDLHIVDKNLIIIKDSMQRAQKIMNKNNDYSHLLVQNNITGCTVMINKYLKNIALPFPKNIVMHDWWLGLVAYLSGVVAYLDVPTILYRQHNNNVVGAQMYIKNILMRMCSIKENKESIKRLSNQLKEAIEYKGGLLFKEKKREEKIAQAVINKETKYLLHNRCRKNDIFKTIGFYLMLIYLKYVEDIR